LRRDLVRRLQHIPPRIADPQSTSLDPATHEPYTITNDGFRATYYEMVGQYGTHVDPPAHFAENGATMDQISLKQMILPLIVFDATPLLSGDPNHAFSVDDIKNWERKNGGVSRGTFVALRTDMSKDFERDPECFKRHPFPAWSLEAIKFFEGFEIAQGDWGKAGSRFGPGRCRPGPVCRRSDP
jgi:kynurenine formamidase